MRRYKDCIVVWVLMFITDICMYHVRKVYISQIVYTTLAPVYKCWW